jgi:hypothetical protein
MTVAPWLAPRRPRKPIGPRDWPFGSSGTGTHATPVRACRQRDGFAHRLGTPSPQTRGRRRPPAIERSWRRFASLVHHDGSGRRSRSTGCARSSSTAGARRRRLWLVLAHAKRGLLSARLRSLSGAGEMLVPTQNRVASRCPAAAGGIASRHRWLAMQAAFGDAQLRARPTAYEREREVALLVWRGGRERAGLPLGLSPP